MWRCGYVRPEVVNSRKEGGSWKFKLGQRDEYRNCSGSDVCSKGTVRTAERPCNQVKKLVFHFRKLGKQNRRCWTSDKTAN